MKIKRDKKFWFEVAAWAVALAVLIAALICYNVGFKKDDGGGGSGDGGDYTVGSAVGNLCPDFTLELYQGGGQYNLYENRGKITFINFWYIGCIPCENEMPYIGALSLLDEYDIEIVAIHGFSVNNVDKFIEGHGWNEYNIKFAQDTISNNDCQTFKALGGKQMWPLTVILDEEGIVRYNSSAAFHSLDDLKSVIDGIKNNG